MSNSSPSIAPLPPEVAAQINSSTAIPSLISVVLGLVVNSLDAEAHKIDVSVDFRRGAVSVEDDGSGIPPKEFTEAGGLGKPYHTSKLNSVRTTYGRNGTFLTSVAALSILTITSHHCSHAQHATIILHHSRPAARLIPAPPTHSLSHREHGTRVIVQDLFGNMPVRVKQRAAGSENGEDSKQIQILIRQIVALVLAWHKPLSISLKNVGGNGKLQIRDTQNLSTGNLKELHLPPVFDLSLICSILSQAGYIDPSAWDSWTKTSARTPFVTVKGAISLRPVPSKQFQFISLGMCPMYPESANNPLYEEVNRLFASSSFGTQDENSNKENAASPTSSNNRRFKSDGNTSKQLKGGRKGVDRWPMFYIRIELQEDAEPYIRTDVNILRESTLSSILKVLDAMITGFLKANHLRPCSRLKRLERLAPTKPGALKTTPKSQRPDYNLPTPKPSVERYQEYGFNAWSRIKVGTHVIRSATASTIVTQAMNSEADAREGTTLSLKLPVTLQPAKIADTSVSEPSTNQGCEQMFEWRNPASGMTILINGRTGLVVDPRIPKRPTSAPSQLRTSASLPIDVPIEKPISNHMSRLTRSISSTFVPPRPGSWAGDLLGKWENPVFETTEESIPQVSLSGPKVEGSNILDGRLHFSTDLDIQNAFMQSSTPFSTRLSKSALRTARVISQVDKKYVLICMKEKAQTTLAEESELVVLVDQHAADERIRVEDLLANLSSSPTRLAKPIIFEIEAREHNLLVCHAAYFADWGVIYELLIPPGSLKCRVSVTALPSAIAERCRIEPKILLEILRTEVWKRGEQASLGTTKNCPQGLVEMLNSRACRSAIMFNDDLTQEEARNLIHRLGDCAFPFQCAHGRPSMIPLVELGSSSTSGFGEKAFQVSNNGRTLREKGFGEAWAAWKPSF